MAIVSSARPCACCSSREQTFRQRACYFRQRACYRFRRHRCCASCRACFYCVCCACALLCALHVRCGGDSRSLTDSTIEAHMLRASAINGGAPEDLGCSDPVCACGCHMWPAAEAAISVRGQTSNQNCSGSRLVGLRKARPLLRFRHLLLLATRSTCGPRLSTSYCNASRFFMNHPMSLSVHPFLFCLRSNSCVNCLPQQLQKHLSSCRDSVQHIVTLA